MKSNQGGCGESWRFLPAVISRVSDAQHETDEPFTRVYNIIHAYVYMYIMLSLMLTARMSLGDRERFSLSIPWILSTLSPTTITHE